MSGPRILIIGAGAVGQVFGYHFAQAGAEVWFFARNVHRFEKRLPLLAQAKTPVGFEAAGWVTKPEQVARKQWDQVWVTAPANTLGDEWLPPLLAAAGDATVVAFASQIEAAVAPARRVMAVIPFTAWQHPLPGQTGPAAIAYWLPPLARVAVSGADARVAPLLAMLKGGALPAQRVDDAMALGTGLTALLIPLVAALEGAGWKHRDFKGQWPALAAGAAREAMRVLEVGGLWKWAAQGLLLRFGLWVADRVLPFDFERYLEYHFTKVGPQTRAALQQWVAQAQANQQPCPSLQKLARGLP